MPHLLIGDLAENEVLKKRSVDKSRADEVEIDIGTIILVLQASPHSVERGFGRAVGSGHGSARMAGERGEQNNGSAISFQHVPVECAQDRGGAEQVDAIDLFPVAGQGVMKSTCANLDRTMIERVDFNAFVCQRLVGPRPGSTIGEVDCLDGGAGAGLPDFGRKFVEDGRATGEEDQVVPRLCQFTGQGQTDARAGTCNGNGPVHIGRRLYLTFPEGSVGNEVGGKILPGIGGGLGWLNPQGGGESILFAAEVELASVVVPADHGEGQFEAGPGCAVVVGVKQGMQGFFDRVGRERESEAFLGFLQSEGLFFAEGGPQFLEKTGEMAGKRIERAGESRGGLVGKDDFEGASGKIERAKKFSDGNFIFMIEISR